MGAAQHQPASRAYTSARVLVPALVTLGGVAALSWEAVWQLRSSLALGVSALGTALTLATTMAGMTAGSLAAGSWLRRREVAQPLRLYGLLEGAIGLAGLLLPLGFAVLERLDTQVFALAPALAPGLHVSGIALLLGVPAFAMGATIPVFEILSRRLGVPLSLLYGLNTAGAAVGILLFAFVLLPSFGLATTSLFAASINLAVCVAALLLGRAKLDRSPLQTDRPVARTHSRVGLGRAEIAVFTTGFVTFGLEVSWFRSLRAAFQSTTDSFAIMLASVLVALALGARFVPWLRRRGAVPATLLGLAAPAILLATPVIERFDLLALQGGSYEATLIGWFALSLATMGPSMILLGTILPWHLDETADPGRAGRLYAINTLGAVLGSLLSAWALLPAMGFARTSWLLGSVVALVALGRAEGRARGSMALAAALCMALAVGTSASLGRDRVQGMDDLKIQRIVAYDESPDSTVAVIEGGDGVRRLVIDGFVATSELSEAAAYMAWMGRLPMLLHPAPRTALVIAFGTGQTANGTREPGLERLDIVDISASVLGMAPLFEKNDGVLDDPRVHARVMDGRAWVRRTRQQYDVITLEPMPPYFAGMNSLYSREFYQLVAERLGPGGIAVQWLPVHLLPRLHSASVVGTFAQVFADSILWVDPTGGTGVLLGRLAGSERPLGDDWPGFARTPGPMHGLSERAIRDAIVLGPEGMAAYGRRGRVISDDNQLLAYGRVLQEMWAKSVVQLWRTNHASIREVARSHPPRPTRRAAGATPR